MDTTKAREYMEHLQKLNALINNKLVESRQWRDIALRTTAEIRGERVQSSSNPQKMADAIHHYVDLERETDALIDEYIDAKKERIAMIERLKHSEYDVLHKLYIQEMHPKEYAYKKGKSYSWVRQKKRCALENLQIILDREQIEDVPQDD